MIAVFIRYQIDSFKKQQFEAYARRWLKIIPRCGGDLQGGRPSCQCIGPVKVDDIDGVDAVARRLRHPFTVTVLDHGVDEDVLERHFPCIELAEDHHPGDPERDDIAARQQNAGGIPFRQISSLLRPAERAVRPECRGEPGVEDVGVLDEAV